MVTLRATVLPIAITITTTTTMPAKEKVFFTTEAQRNYA
jgi:hypothetical protein